MSEPTEIMVGDENGQVFLRFKTPIDWCALDPQNAFMIGEAIARAAHKAKFGSEPPDDASYIGQQIRERVTEELRDRMVMRASLVMGNLYQKKWSPGKAALELVDIVLSMAQGKTI